MLTRGLIDIAPFWAALLVSALAASPIYRLLVSMKSRQTVSQYAPEGHQVKQGTPTMGGLIIVLGVLAGILVAASLSAGEPEVQAGWNLILIPGIHGVHLAGALILLLGFALIGFVDDFLVPRLIKGKRGLGWKQKILMQIFFAVLATGVILGWAVTAEFAVYVFLILFAANAYNFLDGLDALAGSVLITLCVGLLVLAGFRGMIDSTTLIPQVLIAASIPFLFMNAPPAKIFMGDVGSLPIGALLGLVFSKLLYPGSWTFYTPYSTLSSETNGGLNVPLILPLLIMGFILIVELVPVPLQILWVKLFKRRLFLYTPIHHAFEKKGWPETRVVWGFVLSQIVLCALAYTIALVPRADANISGSARYRYVTPGSSSQ